MSEAKTLESGNFLAMLNNFASDKANISEMQYPRFYETLLAPEIFLATDTSAKSLGADLRVFRQALRPDEPAPQALYNISRGITSWTNFLIATEVPPLRDVYYPLGWMAENIAKAESSRPRAPAEEPEEAEMEEGSLEEEILKREDQILPTERL